MVTGQRQRLTLWNLARGLFGSKSSAWIVVLKLLVVVVLSSSHCCSRFVTKHTHTLAHENTYTNAWHADRFELSKRLVVALISVQNLRTNLGSSGLYNALCNIHNAFSAKMVLLLPHILGTLSWLKSPRWDATMCKIDSYSSHLYYYSYPEYCC